MRVFVKRICAVICLFILAAFATSCTDKNTDMPHNSDFQQVHKHSYTMIVTPPNCTEQGSTLFVCDCGYLYTGDIIKSNGHKYESIVIDPTYAADGYTRHICEVCGDSYNDDYTKMPDEIVSALAQKDYLLPLDSFSKEREYAPEFVMLHFTSGVVLSKDDPFDTAIVRCIFESYKVSVHYIIDRDGNISCYIPEDLVAYHAGKGQWGVESKYTDKMNYYSIGIEIMAIGSQEDMKPYLTPQEYQRLDKSNIGYTDAQYASLNDLLVDICSRNNIPMDRQHIIGHQEYSGTKTDPGELFDWDRLFE